MLDFGGSHGFQGKWRRNQSMNKNLFLFANKKKVLVCK